MAFVTEAQVKTELTAILGRAELETDTIWNQLIPGATEDAANEVTSAMVKRGFTAAQAASWDRAKEFSRDIALYWALVKGSATKAYDQQAIDKLDRRKELLTVDVLIGGVEPDDHDPDGRIAVGMLKAPTDTNWMQVDL